MKTFEVYHTMAHGRALVKGAYKDLYPGDKVIATHNGREYSAIVECRTNDGAVIRVVLVR